MAGDYTSAGVVAGVSTGAAGVAVLPAAGDNMMLTVLSATAATAGMLVLLSFCITWLLRKKLARAEND